MSISRQLAGFVCGLSWQDVPADIQERARSCLLNSYGIALSGWMTPYAPVARRTALALYGQREDGASLLGDGRKTSITGATFANAALFHGRAQEESCGSAHFGTMLVPLLTALFEVRGYPMSRFLPALVAGYEVGGVLEAACVAGSRGRGLRASPLYGAVASAACAAKAMDLSVEQTGAALANAASFAGGTAQSLAEGSDEWRYQVGQAAASGLLAAQLATDGSVSAQHAFEGAAGFVHAFAGQPAGMEALRGGLGALGDDWSLRRVAFKPYPVCAFNQTPVLAALALHQRIDWRSIRRATIRMNPGETGYSGLDAQGPFGSTTATLMSTPFCVATTFIHGEPTMEAIARFDDEAVNTLAKITSAVAYAQMPALSCMLELELADGTRLVHSQMMQAADYAWPWDTLRLKLRRTGELSGVAAGAFDRVESFAAGLPDARLADVLAAFGIDPARH